MYASDPMRELSLIWREEEGVEVLEVAGAIDSRTGHLFHAVMESMARNITGDLRLDCRGITFMSSASVGQVVMLVNERRAHGRKVVLEHVPDDLMELFRRMRLETFLGGPGREQFKQ